MQTKKQKQEATKRPPYLKPRWEREAKRRGGIKAQGWGVAADGSLVCAGVDFVPEISGRFIYLIVKHWERWRRWYDKQNNPGKAPRRMLAAYGIHPIDDPTAAKWLRLI